MQLVVSPVVCSTVKADEEGVCVCVCDAESTTLRYGLR